MALVLVVMMFSLIPKGTFGGNRESLESTILDIERAVRFSVNESILRNAVIRISFDLDSTPNSYTIEYGPSSGIVLPEIVDESRLSLRDRENQQAVLKKLSSKFNKVSEFSEKDKIVPEGVRISGIASSYFPSIKSDGEVSIYFYPTGERDNSIIFISTEEEMVTIDIPAFEDITTKEYYTFTVNESRSLEDTIENKMKETFDKWLRQ